MNLPRLTAQQALLAGLLIVFVLVYYYREQIAVNLNDYAGKYWPLPPNGQQFADLIQAASSANGVPFDLIARQIEEESKFDPNVVAADGGSGLMQLTPKYYQGVALFNPQANIDAGVASLASYYADYGSWAQALAAYNAGPGNVNKAIAAATEAGDPSQWLLHLPTPPEDQVITQRYVGQILSDVPLEPLPAGARLS